MFESDFIFGTTRTALCEASVTATLLHGAKCWIKNGGCARQSNTTKNISRRETSGGADSTGGSTASLKGPDFQW